jgi:hypothetical protein
MMGIIYVVKLNKVSSWQWVESGETTVGKSGESSSFGLK